MRHHVPQASPVFEILCYKETIWKVQYEEKGWSILLLHTITHIPSTVNGWALLHLLLELQTSTNLTTSPPLTAPKVMSPSAGDALCFWLLLLEPGSSDVRVGAGAAGHQHVCSGFCSDLHAAAVTSLQKAGLVEKRTAGSDKSWFASIHYIRET